MRAKIVTFVAVVAGTLGASCGPVVPPPDQPAPTVTVARVRPTIDNVSGQAAQDHVIPCWGWDGVSIEPLPGRVEDDYCARWLEQPPNRQGRSTTGPAWAMSPGDVSLPYPG